MLIDKDTKQPEQELPTHLHDWHEMIFIHKGKGDFYIHNQFYQVMSGDLIIIPQNTVHFANPDSTQLITSTVIYFHPKLLEFLQGIDQPMFLNLLNSQEHFIYTISTNQIVIIENLLFRIKEEIFTQNADFKMAILLLLQMLLVFVYRHSVPTKDKEEVSQIHWLNESVNYITNNFQSSLSLTLLAKQASVSPPHFSRVFKKQMGVNVKEFIITKRISYIKKKLRESNETVETIAKKAGFISMPYFFRTFKKYTGVTPDNFRNRIN
ncbi:helix-turn-helix domain-containing protein [Halalkalibacter okhensis]|uniref:HTH araC/xylS-type domain-containing protein n=1 Tax=Halalkalibacter okhensis TaxID=333138 RepID=A0A0B0IL82_9BACI|nr:AraC family transcriptional regulator [Halalkalibacter okhensis]KHF41657.1 hypothetical protein LQ50_02860 [Halalkalibacter okhensis]